MRIMEAQKHLPKVSVRFTSYQHSKYIAESLKSVLAQDFEDFEIEITDDCSTDNSVEIIRGFNDPRIHLKVQDHNRGVASTATESLNRCRGKYTACMCSDDIWHPNKLSQQVRFLDDHPEFDAVFTLVDIINEEGQITYDPIFSNVFATTNLSRSEWLRKFFFEGNSLCIPSVLIRTDIYKSLNGQNSTLSGLSDFDLWVKFSLNHDFYILPEVLTRFI
jgi:glycosyltransferase involved in cell wall biosynthesis